MKKQIEKDFLEARKNKDLPKKTFLGVLVGEIQLDEKSKNYNSSSSVDNILKRMEKSLNTINTDESRQELEYLKPYLPQLMDEVLIRSIIISYRNTGLNNMGQLMGKFNSEYKGKADNKLVMKIINK